MWAWHVSLIRQTGLPVHAHSEDHVLAAHPFRYAHASPIVCYPLRYPKALTVLGPMLLAGVPFIRGIDGVRSLAVGEELEVPGRPTVIATPGHTYGHVALHLRDRDAVISGDVLVALDPYTALTGPRVVAGAATADASQALNSLEAIGATDARHVLPGHGDLHCCGVDLVSDFRHVHIRGRGDAERARHRRLIAGAIHRRQRKPRGLVSGHGAGLPRIMCTANRAHECRAVHVRGRGLVHVAVVEI